MAIHVIRGKKLSVHGDGAIFVDGKNTNIKQWKSDSTRYYNLSGQEQGDVSGNTLKKALYLSGFLSSGLIFAKS